MKTKLYVLSLLFFFLSISVVCRQQTAPTSRKFTIATYNVKNLFDQDSGNAPADDPKPEVELEALGKIITELDADVLALQEVENIEILTWFRDNYLQGLGYNEVVLIEGNDTRGIDVAVLSRFKVVDTKSHKGIRFPISIDPDFRFSRDLLELKIEVTDDYQFTLFATHLKSKRLGDDTPAINREKRLAQSKKIREVFDERLERDPDLDFVLVGDLNDEPDSKPLKTILGSEIQNKLYATFEELDEEEAYTHTFRGHPGMIDYILVSPGMVDEYVEGSIHILHSETAKLASDHFPVEAAFAY